MNQVVKSGAPLVYRPVQNKVTAPKPMTAPVSGSAISPKMTPRTSLHFPAPMRVVQAKMSAPPVYRPVTGTPPAILQRHMGGSVVQGKCATCGAKSHSTSKCPKTAVEEESTGGRGLTQGNKKDLEAFEVCLAKLDVENLYDDGAKSLVGGRKGKPSGLDDTSYRIDRQRKGNVQFQKGGVSLGKVTFSESTKPGAITRALRLSVQTATEIEL